MKAPKSPEEIQLLLEEAFAADPKAPLSPELKKVFQEHPETREAWQELLTLRKGMEMLEQGEEPSQWVLARIRKIAREKILPSEGGKLSRMWRILLNQQMIAVATVILIIGFGVYAHYWRKEPKLQKISPSLSETKEGLTEEKPSAGGGATPQTPLREAPLLAPKPPQLPPTKSPSQTPVMQPPQNEAGTPATQPAAPAVFMGRGVKFQALEANPGGTSILPNKEEDHRQQLLQLARQKIGRNDFAGALRDLLDAQKIQDSEEIRKLIAECRENLEPASEPR